MTTYPCALLLALLVPGIRLARAQPSNVRFAVSAQVGTGPVFVYGGEMNKAWTTQLWGHSGVRLAAFIGRFEVAVEPPSLMFAVDDGLELGVMYVRLTAGYLFPLGERLSFAVRAGGALVEGSVLARLEPVGLAYRHGDLLFEACLPIDYTRRPPDVDHVLGWMVQLRMGYVF